jgi:uncharacterized protein
MKPSDAFHANRAAIRRVLESLRAQNARVFGSVLDGVDTGASDLDILTDRASETTLLGIVAIEVELERLLGLPVDALTPRALPDSFRNQVLPEAMPV